MIENLRIRGLLSFGWTEVDLALRPLNLFIGPNGSGKSNLLDVLDLLRSVPGDIVPLFGRKGGAREWLHRARDPAPPEEAASIEVVLRSGAAPAPLTYRLQLALHEAEQLAVVGEELQVLPAAAGEPPFLLFSADRDSIRFKVLSKAKEPGMEEDPRFGPYKWMKIDKPRPSATAVALLRSFQLVKSLVTELERLQLVQSWQFGPDAAPRRVDGPADQLAGALLPNGVNLGVMLERLRQDGPVRERLREAVRCLYEDVDDIETETVDGRVRFALRERGLGAPIPPSRMSDGTLRWLGLLCVLLDPTPPPIVCLEEPELGLHPDLLLTLADLLRDAAERTQLIVTTHSDRLISAFTDSPEDVVVCERYAGGTTMRRLERERLTHWLERYHLGEIWMSGEIGGTRS